MNTIYRYQTEGICGKTVVIFGFDWRAKDFALRLLSNKIRFDFFLSPLSEETYILPCILNKSVISIETCKKLENYVVIAPYCESLRAKEYLRKNGLAEHYLQMEFLAPLIEQANEVVVYGTGKRSEHVYKEISSFADITYYCDSNKDKSGTMLRERMIIHPSQLNQLSDHAVIIIASTAFEEIMQNLRNTYHIREDCIFVIEYRLVVYDNSNLFFMIDFGKFWTMIRDIEDKDIIIYGWQEWVESLVDILNLLDIKKIETLKRKSFKEDGTIFQLAYYDTEDKVCLLADSRTDRMQSALLDLKIAPEQIMYAREYDSLRIPSWLWKHGEHECLDPSLGIIIVGEKEEIPGFIQYQYCENDDNVIRILTLGGSTTTGYCFSNRPWSFFLSEMLKEREIPHVIYCGGIEAYNVSHELVRLLRDGIWLKPDIVISYSGVNNMFQHEPMLGDKSPFLDDFQEKLFERLENNPIANASPGYTYSKYYGVHYGVNPEVDLFDYWLSQISMMYAVCSEFGIQYRAFLQPVLYSKRGIGQRDASTLYQFYNVLWDNSQRKMGIYSDLDNLCLFEKSAEIAKSDSLILEAIESAKHFREKGKSIKKNWFVDLSGMFDDFDGLYIDFCHVNERANKIIAKNILDNLDL